jgi:hypothetical protein
MVNWTNGHPLGIRDLPPFTRFRTGVEIGAEDLLLRWNFPFALLDVIHIIEAIAASAVRNLERSASAVISKDRAEE